MTDPSVPIVPGTPTLNQLMPGPAVKPPKRWLKPALIALAIVVVGTAGAVGAWYFLSKPTVLEQAATQCDAGEIGDGGDTLFVDTVGTVRLSGNETTADLACVLKALNTPAFIIRAMERTNALAGRQTESWDGISASWTYHPDEGLDVTFHLE